MGVNLILGRRAFADRRDGVDLWTGAGVAFRVEGGEWRSEAECLTGFTGLIGQPEHPRRQNGPVNMTGGGSFSVFVRCARIRLANLVDCEVSTM